MGVTYVNRGGKTYFLQQSQTKFGTITYSFTTKLTKTPVDVIPDGFEIHERPETGQVYLRKQSSSTILPIELAVANAALHKAVKYECTVVVEKDSLVIYVAGGSEDDDDQMIDRLAGKWMSGSRRDEMRQILRGSRPLVKMLRLTLSDEDERLFSVERWCFRGSIDNWIDLDNELPLSVAIDRYFEHLGQESFYDLI